MTEVNVSRSKLVQNDCVATNEKVTNHMKKAYVSVTLCLILGLMGCENQNTYPLTGEECGPDDPVTTLDARDCTPI